MSGAGRGVQQSTGEGLGARVGLAAAGLVAAGLGQTVAEATIALPGFGAVGGPRGFGDTGGRTRFISGERKYCQFDDNQLRKVDVYTPTKPSAGYKGE